MSDTMLTIDDFQMYFEDILKTANQVSFEILDGNSNTIEPSRLLRSMKEIDDAILTAINFNELNLTMQTKSQLSILVKNLDDAYNLYNNLYAKKAN